MSAALATAEMGQGFAGAAGLEAEARLGLEALRGMSAEQLREVIDTRVQMLENVLKERDLRREALETAKLASRILDLRQERSRRIQKNVNLGSAIAAATCTVLIVAAMA